MGSVTCGDGSVEGFSMNQFCGTDGSVLTITGDHFGLVSDRLSTIVCFVILTVFVLLISFQ